MCVISHFSHVQLFVTLWTIDHQTLLSMGFSMQEILEWIAILSFRGSSISRIEPFSLASPTLADGFFTTSATWEALLLRIDAFELWCWRRLLRVPWTARRYNQSILKETSPVCSLERLMLRLKLQYFGHLMRRVDSLEKTLMLGKDPSSWWWQEEKGMKEDEMAGWHHRLDAHEFGWTLGVGDGQGDLACCDSWGHKELDMTELNHFKEESE